MSVNPGELHFTTRGIAEIQSFYEENGLNKVRFWLHTVDKTDGVTATGDALLMSTTPDNLEEWMTDFPRDLEERRRAVVSRNMHEILNRMDRAKADGPTVKTRRL